ncbi:low molecular weight protein-tyrosine-phosphatase [Halorhodospira sp. 9621]|uniref:low molecular weight protein-tyrosine-phosphatase n=1 Tax=Halorhodospira sp. 9621 TaxID=2899135 RepID=UPI002378C298|nr:low molecular weight protein-tyrosine-phosphatase [Halorhodospira sp. 9621]
MHPLSGNVLVVCTGNICRSPMAERMLQAASGPEGPDRVESVGIGALVGAGADPHAVAVMDEIGLDLRDHTARSIDSVDVARFDLILVMERGQQAWLARHFPELRGRTFRIGHWQERDVPDPFRRSKAAFRAARDQLQEAVFQWQGMPA